MKKISCNIITDVLPLYLEDVVSDDTKEMVEEHLKSCDSCRMEAEALKQDVVLPSSQTIQLAQVKTLKNLKSCLQKKTFISSLVSSVLAVVVIVALISFLTISRICIPYDNSQIFIMESDETIYAVYNGNDLSGSVAHHPVSIEMDGKEQDAVLFYIYTSPWLKFTSLFDKKELSAPNMVPLGNVNEIDTIYYGKFSIKNTETDISTFIEKSKLIWGG